MTSKSASNDELLVTDAVLSNSRTEVPQIPNESTPGPNDFPKNETFEQIDDKPKRKAKFDKLVNTSINGAVINISSSSHVRIGSDIHYNIVSNPKKELKKDEKIQRTPEIEALFLRSEKLEFIHLDFVASHLGSEWKNLGRKLQFSDGQLEQFQLDYKNYKLKEVIYQMLLAWTREYPEEAHLGHLATSLWSCNLRDVVQRMANQFSIK